MITSTYTLSTTQQTTSNTVSTIYTSITGTNDVTFSLANIDQSESTVDKAIVTFYDNRELVFSRSFTDGVSALTGTSFTETIENEVVDLCHKKVVFYLHRDDGYSETYTVDFTVHNSALTDYVDINLVKTDFFETDNNGQSGDTVMLTFEGDNPGLVGNNYLNITTDNYFESGTVETSGCSASVGFEDEFDIVAASRSFTEINVNRLGCTDTNFNVKYRTRVGVGTALIGTEWYMPAVPNTQFIHVSGHLDFLANDPEVIKNINVPVIDAYGVDLSRETSVYLGNVTTGVGTSMLPVSGGYFFVDIYDLSGCETVSLATSTLTAFITY